MSQGRPGAVYPRVCGVDSHPPSPLPPMHGLSPRVRGRSRLAGPLCAGSVYPRVCGVDSFISSAIVSTSGLSPRVRGRYLHFDFLPTAEAGGIPVAYETRSSVILRFGYRIE